MRKRTLLFTSSLCIAGMLLSLFGCKSAEKPSEGESDAVVQTDAIPDVGPIDSPDSHTGTIEDLNIPVSIIQARPFSEGIAWVEYENQAGEKRIGWLHPDGHIDQPFPYDTVAQLNEDDPYWVGLGSNFSEGYSYVKTGDAFVRGASENPDSFLILNQKGEITFKSPADGSSYEILCGGDGVYLVKQSVRSMTENEDRYGIIAATGEWLLECIPCDLGGESPFSPADITANERRGLSFKYCGLGIFMAHHQFAATVWQNVFFSPELGLNYRTTADVEIVEHDEFIDRIPVKVNGQLHLLSQRLEMTPVTVDTTDMVSYYGGYIFAADRSYGGNRKTSLENAKFYRPDGTVAIDLSQYSLVYEDAYELYRFNNGYSAIIVAGADGDQYLGIIDSTGEFTFEPKNISMPTNYDLVGTFSSGVIVCARKDNSFSACIVDIGGTETQADNIEWERIGKYVFCEGFAYDEYNHRYIGIDGNILNIYIK